MIYVTMILRGGYMDKNIINILWVESRSYLPEDSISKHSHSFFHYIYVANGGGEIKINDTTHRLTSGCIYLIKPGEEHSFSANATEKLVTYEIKFEAHSNNLSYMLYDLPSYVNVTGSTIYEAFSRIHTEHVTKKPYFKELSSCLLTEVIFALKRSVQKEAIKDIPDIEDGIDEQLNSMKEITVYIKNNIDNNITLQELADLVKLEKTYFIKKFKSVIGTTPMQYVKKARLERAKKLLLYSDMNITQISDALNFTSIHRFSEFFINEVGISPQKFKKQEKNHNIT